MSNRVDFVRTTISIRRLLESADPPALPLSQMPNTTHIDLNKYGFFLQNDDIFIFEALSIETFHAI